MSLKQEIPACLPRHFGNSYYCYLITCPRGSYLVSGHFYWTDLLSIAPTQERNDRFLQHTVPMRAPHDGVCGILQYRPEDK